MNLPLSRTLQVHTADNVEYFTFPSFDRIPGIKHGFSTRLGGVSHGIYESMNLSFTRGDDDAAVRENFRRFCDAIGVRAENVVISAQTHTTNIYNATAADRGRGITFARGYTDVDGLLTDEPDVVLCTQYADCVPLFFVDPVRRVVGTSHAGWRGTAAGMARVTVERMHTDYGCEPSDVFVGIGPSIGRCCFEVDAPVLEAFAATEVFDDTCCTDDGNGKFHIDLWKINRRFLLKSGVKSDHITATDVCTRCHPDVLWSHRYCGKERGSLAGLIALTE